MIEQIEYRLALILPDSRKLLAIQESGHTEVPRVVTSGRQRQVEQLTLLVEEKWRIKAVVLEVISEFCAASPCAIMEVRSICSELSGGLQPVDMRSLGRTSLEEEERQRLDSILSDEISNHRPFTRIGWIEVVQRWIRDSVTHGSPIFNGDILQLNAGGGFALCRLGTAEGRAYWLKAVGPPNEHEFPVTKTLAELLPNYLPPIVAMREDWNAWITVEAGHSLSDSFTLLPIQRAVAALAELQRESINRIEALQMAGCPDCSIPVLEAHLREITEYLEEAMAHQTSTKVAPIGVCRLRELEQILRNACFRMQDLAIPDTLIHNDINADNILISDCRCAFIDWAEAQTGNPLFTFQHICAQVVREAPEANAWIPAVKRTYKQAWEGRLSEEQIDRAYGLAPVLAVASYLYGRGTWLSSPRRYAPHFQGYARSLARYMDRAARTPELQEAL